jgi:hypothetical protein
LPALGAVPYGAAFLFNLEVKVYYPDFLAALLKND